jgi:YgiT-type zinc finger domain-containing protein
MKPFEKCPVAGVNWWKGKVEKLLRGGGGVNTAVARVPGWVCLRCGERLYSQDTVGCFERIREKLQQNN